MGMMTKMRDNAHIFILAFIVIFVAFWVFTDLDVGSITRGSQNEIAEIDGKSITYQEFQGLVDQMVEERRKQNQGQEVDENTLSSIREQVWNDYVTRAVINRAVEDLGITVTDQEVTDWVRSDNPPEILANSFKDSTGRFNRDAYIQFINNPGAASQEALVQVEKQLKDELVRQKLTTILAGSVQIAEEDLKEKFIDQNVQASATYILLDPRQFAPRDTAAPTDEEYQAYFEKNKKMFKTKEMRKLRYVLFPDVPSAGDSAAIRNELQTLREQAMGGRDFLELVKESTGQPYQERWVNRGQMDAQTVPYVFGQPVGSIVGPVPSEGGFSIYKILGDRTAAEVLTEASHILFRLDSGQDEAKQRTKAEDVLRQARSGADFAALARKYSEEPGAAERSGSLGWFGKGRMVKEFETAALGAKVGDVVGLVKTQFGFHIIKVTGRSAQELSVAEIRMTVKAGTRTRDENYERARNFAYFANEHGFDQEAKLDKQKIEETPEFAKQSGSYIPNIGVNPALVKFAFENKTGAISEVHRGSNGYVVAVVSGVREAGYRPIDELKDQIKPQVIFERQMKKTLDYAKSIAPKGRSLGDIASKNSSLKVDSTATFVLGSGAPGIGRDDAFIGAILRMKPGEISEPFRGLRGVYIVKLDSRTAFDETAFKVKKDELRTQQMQQLQNEFIQSWLEEMKEKIQITDNRDRFFR